MADMVEKVKVPLKWRFKAWWNGYDLEDVKALILRQMHDPSATMADMKNSGSSGAGGKSGKPDGKTAEPMPWDKLRIEMSQLIWGDGYCGPGGHAHVQDMCKLLSMDSKMSAIVLGAGLGGPARVLAQEFGVWISGYELSADLVAQANELSKKAGMDKKVVIEQINPEKAEPYIRKFDRAFSKEALYCFQDKDKTIKDVYDALKDGALFLLTDYTLANLSALENTDVQKWLRQEPQYPYPVTADILKKSLEKVGFTIRVNEDISKEYVELIEGSWTKAETVATQLAMKGQEGLDAVGTLMKEAEFWALRAKLIKGGLIQVRRFLAHKPAKPLS